MTKIRSFIAHNRNIVLPYVMMLILLSIVSILRPGFGFGDINHLRALLLETSVIALVSLGQTLVIISGGADLSLPYTLTTTAVLMTKFTQGQNEPMIWAIPLVLLGAALVGLVNGLGVAYLGISPIVMSLAMNNILYGLIAGVGLGGVGTQGQYGQPPPFILQFGTGKVLEIPYLIIFTAGLTVLATILLSRTGLGRYIYAVGTNETVAQYSGVDSKRVKVGIWVVAGFLNGMAGIILAGKFGRAYLNMGDPYLFRSVTAVIIGGASILGGSGHYLGTIGGAMLLAVLTAMLPALKIPSSAENVIYGLVILFAVFFATNRFRLRRRVDSGRIGGKGVMPEAAG